MLSRTPSQGQADELCKSRIKFVATTQKGFHGFATLMDLMMSGLCSPGLPPVPMNRFPFPSHSPDSASQRSSRRRADVCGVREKASPKNKAKLSPARQAVSAKAKRLSNRAPGTYFTHGMTMPYEESSQKLLVKQYFGI